MASGPSRDESNPAARETQQGSNGRGGGGGGQTGSSSSCYASRSILSKIFFVVLSLLCVGLMSVSIVLILFTTGSGFSEYSLATVQKKAFGMNSDVVERFRIVPSNVSEGTEELVRVWDKRPGKSTTRKSSSSKKPMCLVMDSDDSPVRIQKYISSNGFVYGVANFFLHGVTGVKARTGAGPLLETWGLNIPLVEHYQSTHCGKEPLSEYCQQNRTKELAEQLEKEFKLKVPKSMEPNARSFDNSDILLNGDEASRREVEVFAKEFEMELFVLGLYSHVYHSLMERVGEIVPLWKALTQGAWRLTEEARVYDGVRSLCEVVDGYQRKTYSCSLSEEVDLMCDDIQFMTKARSFAYRSGNLINTVSMSNFAGEKLFDDKPCDLFTLNPWRSIEFRSMGLRYDSKAHSVDKSLVHQFEHLTFEDKQNICRRWLAKPLLVRSNVVPSVAAFLESLSPILPFLTHLSLIFTNVIIFCSSGAICFAFAGHGFKNAFIASFKYLVVGKTWALSIIFFLISVLPEMYFPSVVLLPHFVRFFCSGLISCLLHCTAIVMGALEATETKDTDITTIFINTSTFVKNNIAFVTVASSTLPLLAEIGTSAVLQTLRVFSCLALFLHLMFCDLEVPETVAASSCTPPTKPASKPSNDEKTRVSSSASTSFLAPESSSN